MPKKQKSDAMPTTPPAVTAKPVNSPPAKSRASAPLTTSADHKEIAPKSTSTRSRTAGNGTRKTAKTRSTPAVTAASQTDLESDGFREAVSRLAYHFWEARNQQADSPDADWIRAEQALREALEKLSSRS